MVDSLTSKASTHCLYRVGFQVEFSTDDIVNYFILVYRTYLRTGKMLYSGRQYINQYKQPMWAVDVLQNVNHCLDASELF